ARLQTGRAVLSERGYNANAQSSRSRRRTANPRQHRRARLGPGCPEHRAISIRSFRLSARGDRKLLLPERGRNTFGVHNPLRAPLLEPADKARQRTRAGQVIAHAKEMQMVGHDDEPADRPAVSLSSGAEFAAQDA